MIHTKLKTDDRVTLLPNGKRIEVEYAIKCAYMVDSTVIVLQDSDNYWKQLGGLQFGQFPNLAAYDTEGKKVWTAELPTNESSDCYYEIVSVSPLIVYSWKSYKCTIDLQNGRIVNKVFLK